MPNTLVHLGVQGLACRLAVPGIDLRFVYLACVVPDLPWIVQRAVIVLGLPVDRADLMLAAAAQGSLIFCLLLSAAIALVTLRPTSVFLTLAAGSVMHLALDMVQVKWGRGSILLAPFDWRPLSLDWMWPEHPLFYILTAASLVFVLATWRYIDHGPVLRPFAARRHVPAAILAAAWLAAPAAFVPALHDADMFHARTLTSTDTRTGREVAFDRAPVWPGPGGAAMVELFTAEVVRLEGVDVTGPGLVSVRGRFAGAGTIEADEFHFHPPYVRAAASVLGLLLVALVWARSVATWLRRP